VVVLVVLVLLLLLLLLVLLLLPSSKSLRGSAELFRRRYSLPILLPAAILLMRTACLFVALLCCPAAACAPVPCPALLLCSGRVQGQQQRWLQESTRSGRDDLRLAALVPQHVQRAIY